MAGHLELTPAADARRQREPIRRVRGFEDRTSGGISSSSDWPQCWPTEFGRVLSTSPEFVGIRPILTMPDHQPPFPGGAPPGQCDRWVLARTRHDLVSIAIEEHVGEPFGRSVREWLDDTSVPGRKDRLDFFAAMLEFPVTQLYGMSYRLLSCTISALLEAARCNASHAVLLIHSVSKDRHHFEDFQQYVGLFGEVASPDSVISAEARSNISLHFAWVTGPAADPWASAVDAAGGMGLHSIRTTPLAAV